MKLKIVAMRRPGGVTVFTETGLVVAQFPESVSPAEYQSPRDALKRARLLVRAMKAEAIRGE